jgi:hypothetical protein
VIVNMTASLSSTHHHRRHRKRRFHRPRQALGVDYDDYDVLDSALPPLPPPSSVMSWLKLRPSKETLEEGPRPEIPSDQQIVKLPARRGIRICAWILWAVFVCLNLKTVIALFRLVILSWPNLH